VPWRRFLLFAALLVAATSVVSAVGTEQRRDGRDRRPQTAPEAPPAASRAPVVAARLPRKGVVRARVGDVVRLTVRSRFSDTVELPELAVEGPVDQGVPARLTFVAEMPGRFVVRLRDAGESVGMLVVRT
jgi:hypothetical protein